MFPSLSGKFSTQKKESMNSKPNKDSPEKKVLFLGRKSYIPTEIVSCDDNNESCPVVDIDIENTGSIVILRNDSSLLIEDTRSLMMSIIYSPISLGYFLSFCASEFNSEYLKFFIAVENFRCTIGEDAGNYLIFDKIKNRFHWDTSFESDYISGVGPSHEVMKYLEINQKWRPEMLQIWSEFLDDKDGQPREVTRDSFLPSLHRNSLPEAEILSPHFIYLSQRVHTNIRKRMNRYDLYGASVFTEAVIEMLKILYRDIFPRFCASSAYRRNRKQGRLVTTSDYVFLPSINTLVVKRPESKIIEELSMNLTYKEGQLYSLDEVLCDGLLYDNFLSELKKSESEGLLLCIQVISIFKDTFDEEGSPIAVKVIEDQIWNIYLHFVAIGSSCEISLSMILRESIELSFGSPSKEMFAALENKAMTDLTEKFNTYKNTESYQLMAERAIQTATKVLQIEAGPSAIPDSLRFCGLSETTVETNSTESNCSPHPI